MIQGLALQIQHHVQANTFPLRHGLYNTHYDDETVAYKYVLTKKLLTCKYQVDFDTELHFGSRDRFLENLHIHSHLQSKWPPPNLTDIDTRIH